MSAYTEFRHYSPLHDAVLVRVSMADEAGAEFFALIEDGAGKSYRQRRERALEAIGAAMSQGLAPGQVRYRE